MINLICVCFNLSVSEHGGLFVFNCNYAVDYLNILPDFYYELLYWWSELRDLVDCDGEYINILCGITEKLRSMVKVCFINDIYQKVLSIPKIYFMISQISTPLILLKEKGF